MRWIVLSDEILSLDGVRAIRRDPAGRGVEIEWSDGRVRRITGPDGAEAAWQAVHGLAAPGGADQLGPAVLAAIAEIRRIALVVQRKTDGLPGVVGDLGAVADRLVRVACTAAGDGGAGGDGA